MRGYVFVGRAATYPEIQAYPGQATDHLMDCAKHDIA